MKTKITSLCVVLTVVGLTVANAVACGGGGHKGGGFGGGFGGYNGGHNNGQCNTNNYYSNGGYNSQVIGRAYEPFHSTYICQPGDSFYTVSLKEYGTSANQQYIARFNGLAVNSALVPGQRLVLPSISARGQLSISNRPAGEGDTTAVQGFPTSTPSSPVTSNLTDAVSKVTSSFASATKPVATESALPKVTVGSTLELDGQTFGETAGVARLRVSGLSFPVEVLEWTTSSVKIRLPQLEVTGATKVELEVLRADGSLASKSGIELTPAKDRLASTN